MKDAPLPANETSRQIALRQTGLLDSGAEERFDRITRLAQRLFSVPIALITLIDTNHQRFKSRQGLEITQTSRCVSFCAHAILRGDPLIVEDTRQDPRFADNPLVTDAPAIHFYAGIPLHTASGYRIGTLCIIDTSPRRFAGDDVEMLRDLAANVEDMLLADAYRRSEKSNLHNALADSEERARLVIEGAQFGTWQWNVQTGATLFNNRWAEMLGYSLADVDPTSITTWRNLIDARDLERSQTTLRAHFSGQAEFYDCKIRMRHAQGHWIWVHERGRVFQRTSDGAPLLMYGTLADITEEMSAQQALQASRDQFASLVANLPGVAYRCLLNSQWTMLYISDQIAELAGYPASALINDAQKSFAELIEEADVECVQTAVEAAVAEGRDWHVEYRIRHRDGSHRRVEERGRAVTTEEDGPLVLEGFILDVTSAHEAREEIALNHQALVLLNETAFDALGHLDQQIERALENARAYLGMDAALVSQVESDVYTVRWLHAGEHVQLAPGQRFPLEDTWCKLVLEDREGELFVENAGADSYRAHPCFRAFPLKAYIGVVITVNDRPFGTLSFCSIENGSCRFTESERLFVRLLARWLGTVIEQQLGAERLAKLFDQVPGMIYQFRLFPDGRSLFPFSSPGIETIYGMTPAVAAVDAGPAFASIHPEDRETVNESIRQSARSQGTWRATYRVGTGGASYRWVSGQARPETLSDGSVLWHGYINDIDEHERARQALKRSEGRLRSLFEFAPIGIALNDLETGRFLELNDALLAPTGYTRDEFIALSYWDVTPLEYKTEEDTALKDLRATGRYGPFEKDYIRKDGSRYPVRLQGILSQEPDGRQVIWSLIEDISDRRRIDRMKDQFIATVSHELRTPLTSISGSLGLLRGGAAGQLTARAENLIANAARNGARLAELINDLLDMEKLVAGKMTMHMEVMPVSPIVTDAIEAMTDFGHQEKISLRPPENPPRVRVRVDPGRLIQAMTNLLSNAIKFSSARQTVDVNLHIEANEVVIVVRDRGPGVDPSFRNRLFTRFAQADGADSRKIPGTGLGLAITREIIEQMQGTVGYETPIDGGSRFRITLPVVDFY